MHCTKQPNLPQNSKSALFVPFLDLVIMTHWVVNTQQCFAFIWSHWTQGYIMSCVQRLRSQLLVVNQLCITHEITVQGSILPEQAKSWASPTSRPVVRNRLHFPWCCHSLELFDLGHCTATTMCTVILSSWLSSSSRSSFVFVTKFDKLFYHYVSGWIWFDLEVCTYKFLLMLQHILILRNPMFDLS